MGTRAHKCRHDIRGFIESKRRERVFYVAGRCGAGGTAKSASHTRARPAPLALVPEPPHSARSPGDIMILPGTYFLLAPL